MISEEHDVRDGDYIYYDDAIRDVDPGYQRTVDDMLERYSDDEENDSMYKYMFYVLLLVLVVLFINYKKNNNRIDLGF